MSDTPREVTMLNRAMVAGIAENLIDKGDQTSADALIHAVRCCDEFPECSHVLAWIETREGESARVSVPAKEETP